MSFRSQHPLSSSLQTIRWPVLWRFIRLRAIIFPRAIVCAFSIILVKVRQRVADIFQHNLRSSLAKVKAVHFDRADQFGQADVLKPLVDEFANLFC